MDSSQRTGNRTIQNSAIAPDTTVMNDGSSQLFTITPAAGFYIVDVTVDGSSAGSHAAYGFVDVTAASNRTISGAFDSEGAVGFAPALLTGWSRIWLQREATLCLDCGGVWGKCDVAQVKKLIPDAAFALYCQGSRLEAKGEAQAALEKYAEAIKACPGSTAAKDAEASIRNLKATTSL